MTDASFHVRPGRPDDLAGVVDVMNAWDVAQTGEPDTTAADVQDLWDAPGFSPAADARVAEDGDGRIRGYVEVRTVREGEREIALFVHPDAEETDAGDRLLEFAIRRAGPSVMTTWCTESGPTRNRFESAGFSPVRLFFRMRADLDEIDAPAPATRWYSEHPGRVRLAPFRPGVDDVAVHAALVEAFHEHVRGIPPTLEAFAERHFGHPDFDPALWTVAWDGDQVAGAIVVFDHGDLAFVRDLGVREAWRGKGIATALLGHTFALLRERGQKRLDLGVDASDVRGAVALYERAGFRVLQRMDLMRRPAP